MIKEYFANYFLHMSDVTFDLRNNRMEVQQNARRALARDPGRYRRTDHDRRAPQAGAATILATRPSASPTATASATSISAPWSLPPPAADPGDPDGGAAAGPLRRSRVCRRPAGSTPSRRSRRATGPGSMAAFSSSNRRSSITSTATQRCGNGSRWNGWPRRGSWRPSHTAASGSRWIPCATR